MFSSVAHADNVEENLKKSEAGITTITTFADQNRTTNILIVSSICLAVTWGSLLIGGAAIIGLGRFYYRIAKEGASSSKHGHCFNRLVVVRFAKRR